MSRVEVTESNREETQVVMGEMTLVAVKPRPLNFACYNNYTKVVIHAYT